MKKLNVCIVGNDDRGSASLPYHYNRLGHNAFMVKPYAEGLNWNKEVLWPRLLHKCASQPDKRNFQVHGFPTFDEAKFGEDRFIQQELEVLTPLYESDACVELVDFDQQKVHIDAFHTTANCDAGALQMYFDFAKKHFPHAKWISSSITHWDQNPGGFSPKNVVRMLPASYKDKLTDKNACDFYRHHTEFDLVNVKRFQTSAATRAGFGSFNHNFHVRHPQYYKMFCEMNETLTLQQVTTVTNYGGNVRGHGADVKFDADNGITGHYKTLTPKQAMQAYTTLRGVVHLKLVDWAGGIPSHCLIAGTPLITLHEWVKNSGSEEIFVHNYNALLANDVYELESLVKVTQQHDDLVERLSKNMRQTYESLHSDRYWDAWTQMLANLQ